MIIDVKRFYIARLMVCSTLIVFYACGTVYNIECWNPDSICTEFVHECELVIEISHMLLVSEVIQNEAEYK